MQIIDGYCSEPNIYADDIGQYHISAWGAGDYVLPVGEQLGYELVSNNEITIKDGCFMMQGRRGVIKRGATETCAIENGTQAENRNDLIVIEYKRDTSTLIESHTLKVIKGTPGETAVDPELITGKIPNGDLQHQMPLYRVKLEGLNVVAVEKMFTVGKISPETTDPMKATEEGLAADANLTGKKLKEHAESLNGMRFGYTEEGKPGVIVTGEDGADTVRPFKTNEDFCNSLELVECKKTSAGGSTSTKYATLEYEVPEDGLIIASLRSATNSHAEYLKINDVDCSYKSSASSSTPYFTTYMENVKAGDVVSISSKAVGTSSNCSIHFSMFRFV